MIVPAGISLAVRMIPAEVLEDLRVRAIEQERPASRAGMALLLTAWLVAGLAAWLWLAD